MPFSEEFFGSARTEARCLTRLVEHGASVEAVRELIRIPPEMETALRRDAELAAARHPQEAERILGMIGLAPTGPGRVRPATPRSSRRHVLGRHAACGLRSSQFARLWDAAVTRDSGGSCVRMAWVGEILPTEGARAFLGLRGALEGHLSFRLSEENAAPAASKGERKSPLRPFVCWQTCRVGIAREAMEERPKCKLHGIPLVCFCPACRGSVRSRRKAEASRRNGRLGGRPKKKA